MPSTTNRRTTPSMASRRTIPSKTGRIMPSMARRHNPSKQDAPVQAHPATSAHHSKHGESPHHGKHDSTTKRQAR
jgi:hypothetical protein